MFIATKVLETSIDSSTLQLIRQLSYFFISNFRSLLFPHELTSARYSNSILNRQSPKDIERPSSSLMSSTAHKMIFKIDRHLGASDTLKFVSV